MRKITATLSLMLICIAVLPAHAECPQPTVSELVDYLNDHHRSPEDYVISKFKDHDVAILGESHRIKHDQELIQCLIPMLYKHGIHVLGWEFARAVDQTLIDSLLNGEDWNETLGRKILFLDGIWGYRDYLDILEVAWRFNRTLRENKPPFRVIGVSCDWDFSLFKTEEDQRDPEIRKQVHHGCTEVNYAEQILKEVNHGNKVLVHCGMHHAFTRYKQPVMDENGKFIRWSPDIRMGQAIFQHLSDRVFCISLHYAWPLRSKSNWYCKPVNGVIDSAMSIAGPDVYPVGFDVVGTPFECLGDSQSFYSVGYEDFKLSDFCDGYIFRKPFGEYEVASWIDDFVNDSNIDEARRTHYNLWYRDKGVEDFKASMNRQIEYELWWYQYLGGIIRDEEE